MLKIVVVMFKCGSGVIGRVDIDTLHPSGELLLQRFEGEQVVSVDEHIVGGGVSVVFRGITQKYARLYRRFLPFANPS
jgi:hypothetical protein